jgi:hypothetical protein
MSEFFLMVHEKNGIYKKSFLANFVKFSIGKLQLTQKLCPKIHLGLL